MTVAGAAAGHPRRAEVLDVLRAAPAPLGIADITEAVGIHPNTVRFHLDALAEQGAVVRSMAEPVGRGRPRALYAAVPGMDRGGVRRYQALARILVGELASGPEPQRRAIEAGHIWGVRLAGDMAPSPAGIGAAVTTLTGLLADLDFAPRHVPAEPDALEAGAVEAGAAGDPDDPGHIRLEHCPFLELAEEFGGVVCPLHLGMMQGVLAETGSPLRAAGIQPFAEPGACVVRLATAARA